MQYRMALNMSKHRENSQEEKEWENPVDPAKTSDERDKEQLLRQFKEAKRRKDNLTESEEDQPKKTE